MKCSFTIFAVFQLSRALHVRHEADSSGGRERGRITQYTASDDPITLLPKPKGPLPWWKLPNTNNGEMNALTGQQFHPFDHEDDDYSNDDGADITVGNSVCGIKPCKSSGALNKYYCGQHARCLRDYCQCDFGWKPAGQMAKARGWSGLEAITVWVDAYDAGCTERCNSLSCAEVPRIEGCFDNQLTHENNHYNEATQGPKGKDSLATDYLQLGAIKAPGANVGIGA